MAICFSGQPRSIDKKDFESVRLFYQNLIEPNGGADVYVHAWFDKGLAGKDYVPGSTHFVHLGTWSGNEDELIAKCYEPVACVLESQDRLAPFIEEARAFGFGSKKFSLESTFGMFASIYEANKLKQEQEALHQFKYDVVVRARFDFCLNTKIDCSQLDLTKVYVPGRWTKRQPKTNVNDSFAIGSSENMDRYSSCYCNLMEIMKDATKNNRNEQILKVHCVRSGLKLVEQWKHLTDFYLVRNPRAGMVI